MAVELSGHMKKDAARIIEENQTALHTGKADEDNEYRFCQLLSEVSLATKETYSPTVNEDDDVNKSSSVNVNPKNQAVEEKCPSNKMESILTELSNDFKSKTRINSIERPDEINDRLKATTPASREVEENEESGSSDEDVKLQGRGPGFGIPVPNLDPEAVKPLICQLPLNSLDQYGFNLDAQAFRNHHYLTSQSDSTRKFRRPNGSDIQLSNNEAPQQPTQVFTGHQFHPLPLPIQSQVPYPNSMQNHVSQPISMQNQVSQPIGMQNHVSQPIGMQNHVSQAIGMQNQVSQPISIQNHASQLVGNQNNFQQSFLMQQRTLQPTIIHQEYPHPIPNQQNHVTVSFPRQCFNSVMTDQRRSPGCINQPQISQPITIRQEFPQSCSTNNCIPRPSMSNMVGDAMVGDASKFWMHKGALSNQYASSEPPLSYIPVTTTATTVDFLQPHQTDPLLLNIAGTQFLDNIPFSPLSFSESGIDESIFDQINWTADDLPGIESFNSLIENLDKQEELPETERKGAPPKVNNSRSGESMNYPNIMSTQSSNSLQSTRSSNSLQSTQSSNSLQSTQSSNSLQSTQSSNSLQSTQSSNSLQTLQHSHCIVNGQSPRSSNILNASPFSDREFTAVFSPSSVNSHDSGCPEEPDVADSFNPGPHHSAIPLSVVELECEIDNPSNENVEYDSAGRVKNKGKTTRRRAPKNKKQYDPPCSRKLENTTCNERVQPNAYAGAYSFMTMNGCLPMQNGSMLSGNAIQFASTISNCNTKQRPELSGVCQQPPDALLRRKLQAIRPQPNQPILPPEYGNNSANCSSSVSQQPDDIKFYRYVAGMSTEKLVQPDQDGDTILHIAITRGEHKLVDALLDRLQRNNLLREILATVNHHQQTPLFLAVMMNNAPIVRCLIDRGADVNEIVRKMNSSDSGVLSHFGLLHYAAAKGELFVPTLRELLSTRYIDVNAPNSQGLSPLHISVNSHGNRVSRDNEGIIDSKPAIFLLADHGANLNMLDGLNGKTPLHYIIEKKDARLMSWFLDLVAHLNPKQASTGSLGAPAMNACALGEGVVITKGSADVLYTALNTRTSGGLTPVQLARMQQMALAERDNMVQILLASGARPE